MLLNYGVGEDSWESMDSKEIQPVHHEGNQSWIFIGMTDAEAETPILWPLMGRTDSFEKTLMLGKIEGRRRRGWQRMRWCKASPIRWVRVWVNSGSWWWTGGPGVLQSMGLQRVGHHWGTELKWIDILYNQHCQYINNCWFSSKESACQYRRCRFHSWVRKIVGEGNHNTL